MSSLLQQPIDPCDPPAVAWPSGGRFRSLPYRRRARAARLALEQIRPGFTAQPLSPPSAHRPLLPPATFALFLRHLQESGLRWVAHLSLLGIVGLAMIGEGFFDLSRLARSGAVVTTELSVERRAVFEGGETQGVLLAIAPVTLTSEGTRVALAPELRRPVELIDAFQAVHLLSAHETLGAVAQRYNISLESLIWANGLERGDALAVGQPLRIPRVSGVPHLVTGGETVETIAARFAVPPEQILSFGPNRLTTVDSPTIGSLLFVPGATLPLPEALLQRYGGLAGLEARTAVPAGNVIAAETNIREGPSTEYARLMQLEAGRQVELRARHKDWLLVEISGVQGWIRSDLLGTAPTEVSFLPETNDFPPPPPRWVWPARGTITSRFGPRWGGFHNGLDIANRAWTPIVAARTGVVREAGWCRGYGYCVRIRHGEGIETVYGHLIDDPVVAVGDEVMAGELIGYMGSTYDRAGGGYSTGVHLHLTVYVNGRAVDPLKFLP